MWLLLPLVVANDLARLPEHRNTPMPTRAKAFAEAPQPAERLYVVEPPEDGTSLLELFTDSTERMTSSAGDLEDLQLAPGKTVLSARRTLLERGRALLDPQPNASFICINNCSSVVEGNLTTDRVCDDGAPSTAYCADPSSPSCRAAASSHCALGHDCESSPR